MARNQEKFQEALETIKRNDPTVSKLDLSCKGLNDNDIEEIIKGFKHNNTMTELVLEYNQIGDKGAEALTSLPTITSLILSNNQIGDRGAGALARSTSMTSLDLAWNQIGPEGAEALAKSTCITRLNLYNNSIGDQGAVALARNKSITWLNLQDTGIGDEGAIALATNNTIIVSLVLLNNQIGPKGANALVRSTSITSLDLRNNPISLEDTKTLQTPSPILVRFDTDYTCPSMDAILQKNRSQFTNFMDACRKRSLTTMRAMIEAGNVSPYAQHPRIYENRTVLHEAVHHNYAEVVLYLVKSFPRLLSFSDDKKDTRSTPLQLAKRNCNTGMIAILNHHMPPAIDATPLQAEQSEPSREPPYSAAATISQSRGYAMHTEGAPAPDSGADAASTGYQMGRSE